MTDITKEYQTLREANVARQKEWDQNNQITLSFRGNELAGEVGEACNVIKKLDRERLGIVGSRATKEQLAEELADVVICADLIAMHEGIDLLGEAVPAKFNATTTKVGLTTFLSRPIDPKAEVEPVGWETPSDRARVLYLARKLWNEDQFSCAWSEENREHYIIRAAMQIALSASPSIVAPVGVPFDATPEMVKAALSVDWTNESEEATVHNVWHAMISELPKAAPVGWLYCGNWGEYFVYEKKDTAPGAFYKPLYASPSVAVTEEMVKAAYRVINESWWSESWDANVPKGLSRRALESAIAAAPALAAAEGAQDRMRKALEPFAKRAERFDDIPGIYRCHDNVELWQDGNWRCDLTVGDLREARAALAAQGDDAQEGTR